MNSKHNIILLDDPEESLLEPLHLRLTGLTGLTCDNIIDGNT